MRGSLDLRDGGLLHELIGRPPRSGAEVAAQAFAGEAVLVTGAGGSVGSELARQIAARSPRRLILVDHSEYALFRIEQEMRARYPSLPLAPRLADVTRRRAIRAVFETQRPDVVFHAAAYKHVGMLERDVLAAVRANVFGTLHVAAEARRHGSRFLLISSDKAANPRSVMGASKRLAELAVLGGPVPPAPVAIVRFGNVAGSSGSVLEVMLERIRAGLAIQVTDADATRYFMTGTEAAGLVLAADRLRSRGDIFWLEMGEPVRILDLAHRLANLASAAGLPDVAVEFTGLRPGEKLREELTVQGLELVRTPCDGVWIARQPPVDGTALRRVLRGLRESVRAGDPGRALRLIEAGVPEYAASVEARRAAGDEPPDAYRTTGAGGRTVDTSRPMAGRAVRFSL